MYYVSAHQVTDVHITNTPRNPYATGYGRKIPTRHMLTLTDKRRRRVYAMCYSNAASLYVLVAGNVQFLSVDVEHMLHTNS